MIDSGGGRGPRPVGGVPGCLAMILLSVFLSVLLTVVANVLLRALL